MNQETVQAIEPPVDRPVLEIERMDIPAKGAEAKNPDPATAKADAQNGAEEGSAEVDGESPPETEAEKEAKESRRLSRRQRARDAEVRRLAEAETETRLLRERIARQEGQQPPAATTEPKREEFDSLEDYHRALARHEAKEVARQTIETDAKARQDKETAARAEADSKRKGDDWSKREEAFQAKAKDYEEVVGDFVKEDLDGIHLNARSAILESDLGPELLYHLAKNPDEAERIAKLSPTRQVIEIGKLEDKVVPAKKQSSAPPPVSPVKGKSTVTGFREDMTDAEFRDWSKSKGARWAQ